MNRPCWPMFMSSGQTELFSNGIKLLPELDDGMTDKCIVPSHNCLIHSNFSTGWWEVKLFMAAEIGWSIKLKFNHLCYRLVSAVPTCTLLHIILTTPALFAPSSPLFPSSSLHSPFFASRYITITIDYVESFMMWENLTESRIEKRAHMCGF